MKRENRLKVTELLDQLQDHLTFQHADDPPDTFWHAHRTLLLVVEMLEGAPYRSPRDADAVNRELDFLRSVLRTAADEIAAQGRDDDAAERRKSSDTRSET